MRRHLAPILAAICLLLVPATAAARVPVSFAGMSPQGDTTPYDYSLMASSGIKSVRLPMFWSEAQSENRYLRSPDFTSFDRHVKEAAENGIRIFPFLFSTPSWVAPDRETLPVGSDWERWAWRAFLRDAVERYGPDGTFWDDHVEVDYLPIRQWEIWNEPNIVTFAEPTGPRRYAELIRESGRTLHRLDPGSKVIIGGLFGRPLQVPPNTQPGAWLSGLYRARNVKRFFDGVALHPYVADAHAMRAMIENLRRVMRVHGDGATKLLVTELGWGSDSFESRWERGLGGQARELSQAMAMLKANRRPWRIGGIWWFSWRDDSACQFCDSAGLLTRDREAKPSWYLFNAWTGGDADTVPRADFGD